MNEQAPSANRTPRRILVAGLAIVALVWIAITATAEPELPDVRAGGTPVTLPASGSLEGVDLETFGGILAGQQGRVIVVNLWASWCAPCRAEMPLLQKAADEMGESVVILGVVSNDQLPAAEQFLTEVGVSYPNIFDTDGSIARALDVTAYPTTYVFGIDGEIRARVNGGISEQRLAGLVDDAVR